MDTENLLKAARRAAATNDAVLHALSRIERDLLLLDRLAESGDAEESFAAGMALAVVQYVTNKASGEQVGRCIESIRKAVEGP